MNSAESLWPWRKHPRKKAAQRRCRLSYFVYVLWPSTKQRRLSFINSSSSLLLLLLQWPLYTLQHSELQQLALALLLGNKLGMYACYVLCTCTRTSLVRRRSLFSNSFIFAHWATFITCRGEPEYEMNTIS